jgi:hypothetical protein
MRTRSCRGVEGRHGVGFHDADTPVSGEERRVRLGRPVAAPGVDVGVADAAGLHAYSTWPGPGR